MSSGRELDDARGESPGPLSAAVAVSVLDEDSLDRLCEAIWALTGLIRVFPRRNGRVDEEPFAFPDGATVADLADRVHHDLATACTGALV
jgi:ribosome-interacting GTPase 1